MKNINFKNRTKILTSRDLNLIRGGGGPQESGGTRPRVKTTPPKR